MRNHTQLTQTTVGLQQVANTMQGLIDSAATTFTTMKTHQKEYLEELGKNVADLETQITNLLRDYANQANSQTASHLRVWSESITSYSTQMNRAMKTLSGLVDEIDTKVGA